MLITGAAGNLGGLLATYLQNDQIINLNLMIHNKDVISELRNNPKIRILRADLSNKETIRASLNQLDVVVHFAGILFRHNPEKFLPITNLSYFKNLLEISIEKKVKRVILISFPHVEGESFYNSPAKGVLNKSPNSIHALTRLEEEKYLFSGDFNNYTFEPVSLRLGMVYGKGILMIDAAKWLLKHRLLGVWRKLTWIHLVSKDDFLLSVRNAIMKPNIHGIYHIGDEGAQTLQEFLDTIAKYWGYKKPWRLPAHVIFFCSNLLRIFFFCF